MESVQIIALVVFLITIGVIIWGKLDRAVVGLVGVALMVLLGVVKESEAFLFFVNWNVIAILFSIWIIASYFGKTGIPQYLAVIALRLSRNNIAMQGGIERVGKTKVDELPTFLFLLKTG